MLIAKQKKKENIAEYILYIWQIEDLLRAYKLDENQIDKGLVDQFQVPALEKQEIRNWYSGLIEMMHLEKKEEKGHLVFIKNTVNDLNKLHLHLLRLPQETVYREAYTQARAFLNALAEKNKEAENEIELCFIALYGLMMMRLSNRKISKETEDAVSVFSKLIVLLSKKYHQIEKGEIELNY